MIPSTDDTIVAIASPPGGSLRGIVRLSGPQAMKCVAASFVAGEAGERCEPETSTSQSVLSETGSIETATSPHGDQAVLNAKSACTLEGFLSLDSQTKIPGKLMLWPTNQSFTRQPSAEFHTVGATPVLQMAVKAFCRDGARMAEPGEFTMRAFLSGRIDLTQAEAVLAVIDSKNREQLSVALDQLAGGLAKDLDQIRNQLLSALAELEAGLDFVEEDIEFITNEDMIRQLAEAQTALQRLLSQIDSRDREHTQFRVGFFGLPNAGKSSLFNAVLGEDLAIVTDSAGTTTDKVTAHCRLESMDVELADTAGFEAGKEDGSIAQASQEQMEDESTRCDLAVLCIDANDFLTSGLSQWHRDKLDAMGDQSLVVLTQADRLDEPWNPERTHDCDATIVLTSSLDQTGLSDLKQRIVEAALNHQSAESSIVGSTVVRTGECLRESLAAIESGLEAATLRLGDEIVASEVRLGLDSLGQIVGKVYTDDILDVVFGRFCIGK